MLLITIIILLFYLILIGSLSIGFDKVTPVDLEDKPAQTKFSIIIPFRNEANRLPDLLASILALNYNTKKFEILFVDDHSEDTSVEQIETLLKASTIDFRIISNDTNATAPKKTAISKAIEIVKYEWIITTDADCILPKYWLDAFDCFIQKTDTLFIVAPVTYEKTNTLLGQFQLLDFFSLQGVTIGCFGLQHPIICNGANLAYTKTLFNELKGFQGNTHISSGDDVFLLQKATKRHSKYIHYLKDEKAVVKTLPQPDFKSLLSQRVRWASKSSNYNSFFAKIVGVIVFLMNGFLVSAPLLMLAGFMTSKTLLYTVIIKFCVDFLLLFKTARFFNQESFLPAFFWASFLYPFFSVYVVFVSVFKGYKWKDRKYNK